MAMEAFDLAERLQTIVYVMSDLDLGMNTWMAQPFTYPEKPLDRGKVLDEAKVRELGAAWGRYKDVDGDGIPWRSLPGTGAPAFFTRGSGHNEMAQYTERPDDYVKNLDRLARKFDTAKTLVPAPVVEAEPGATVGIIAFGSSHWARRGVARPAARGGRHSRPSYLRLRAYPFTPDGRRVHPPPRPRLRRRAEPRRADAEPAAHGRATRRCRRASAACCTTTACRSTRAASPTAFCAAGEGDHEQT